MKVVLLFSGGLDSTVCLYHFRNLGHEILPLHVAYGQRHWREIQSAVAISPSVKTMTINGFDLPGNALTGKEPVPDGHYTDETMRVTVVPNRNMIFLSLGVAYAISEDANSIALAAHAGDHAIYPDCRPFFLQTFADAVAEGNYAHPEVHAPFIHRTKADIVQIGAELNVPFGLTWSCYKGGEKHCGMCGTCYERKEAFELARVDDPTEYLV